MEEEFFLGFLNDDCWRYVLDYLPVKDILSVAQVCIQWEAVVQGYFQGVRIRIETIKNIYDEDEELRRRKCRILTIENDRIYFDSVLNEWGNFVVELVYKAENHNDLWNLAVKCPNIQNITLVRSKWKSYSCHWAPRFERLKRVCFENCTITDNCVSELMKHNKIEELVLRMTASVTGSFLVQDNSRTLKTLILVDCFRSSFSVLSALEPVNYLPQVTKLEMRELGDHVYGQAHLILNKMPQLEHLSLDCSKHLLNDKLLAAVGRLGRLRHLGWLDSVVLRGRELEAALKDVSCLMSPTRLSRVRDNTRWQQHRHLLCQRQWQHIIEDLQKCKNIF